MKVVLAEKPSVARDIARHLGATTRRKGWLEGSGWAVTWALGHLVELKEPEDYDPKLKRWRLEDLPVVPGRFGLRPRGGDAGVREQLNTVARLLKEAEEIVCATDAGREGELIFRYIQRWSRCARKPFRRLWISSLTPAAIAAGFKNLRDGHEFDALYAAARCRSEADWIVGLNATRYHTVRFGGRGVLWSVGRVQTPVLAMIAGRDAEIENFVPEDYWEVHTRYREATFKHTAGKFKTAAAADEVAARVRGHDLAVTSVETKRERVLPPLLHDLTDLQKEMNRRTGMTADRTLRAAQSLYEKKHITYPRTDSRHLGRDLEPRLAPLLEALRTLRPTEVGALDLAALKVTRRMVDDAKVSDHHAIIPTDLLPPGPGSLRGDERAVYDAVVTRFIAAFYPPCIKGQTTVLAESAGEPFKATGTTVVDPGWQALYPHLLKAAATGAAGAGAAGAGAAGAGAAGGPGKGAAAKSPAKKKAPPPPPVLPTFVVGEHGPHRPEVKALKTQPPKRFTEATLLQRMETAGRLVEEDELKSALKEKGLGTPATRAAIIETLLGRRYIERQRKNLVSTESGRRLLALVRDERLKSPELTGEWEARLKRIEQRGEDPARFMADVVAHTRTIVGGEGGAAPGPSGTAAPAPAHAAAGTPPAPHPQAGAHAQPAAPARPTLGDCPRCGAPVIEGKRGFGCSRWRQGCRFVLWKETAFGATLGPDAAIVLLATGKTATALPVEIDGRRELAHLVLAESGELTAQPVPPDPLPAGAKSLGLCPLCGGPVVESPKAFGCHRWRQGCPFTIWKTMAKKKIGPRIARALLRQGQTDTLEGFTSKAGKKFSAKLRLDETGKVVFDFGER